MRFLAERAVICGAGPCCVRSPNRAVGLSTNPRWGARAASSSCLMQSSRDSYLTFHPFIPALSSLLSRALAFTPTGRGSVDWLSQSTRSTTQVGSRSRRARRSDTVFVILKQARSGFFISLAGSGRAPAGSLHRWGVGRNFPITCFSFGRRRASSCVNIFREESARQIVPPPV